MSGPNDTTDHEERGPKVPFDERGGPVVTPVDGPELDRTITTLLNAAGVIHRITESVQTNEPELAGVEIIDAVAERMRRALVLFEEHHTDAELASATEFLALATLLMAEQEGTDDVFYAAADPRG